MDKKEIVKRLMACSNVISLRYLDAVILEAQSVNGSPEAVSRQRSGFRR